MMAMPLAAMDFITFSNCWASLSVSTAVGSSNTSSFMPVLSISRAISMNCMWPMGRPLTRVYSSMLMPTSSRAFRASRAMASVSRNSRSLPRSLLRGQGLLISRFSLMLSVTEKPGISMNSWCTMPMPLAMASMGEAMCTFCPSSSTSPSKPPVEWMTGMPKRMFISVLLPAPFSPRRAWISPGRIFRETSLSTALEPYILVIWFISRM